MRKTHVTLLVGTLAFAIMLAGCGSATKKEETTNGQVKETTTVQSGESNAEQQKETADEQPDDSDTEPETRTDGSTISGNTYHDEFYGFTMTLPDGWKDGVYIQSSNGEKGHTLKFVEKSNYDSDDDFGWLLTISASEEEVDENSNNDRSMGSIVDQQGNRIFLLCTTPSDVQCDINDETLMENYRAVSVKREEAISSIVFDADRDYTATVNANGITLGTADGE